MKTLKLASSRHIMENLLIQIVQYSFALYFLIGLAYPLLARKQEQVQTQRMRKYLKDLPRIRKYQDLSLTYVKNPKLRILIWTKSYHSWTKIVTYVLVSIFIVQLLAGLVLVVN